MKIIGLTGGIGSGKSTVARIFESLGIAIYYADDRAKALYLKDGTLKRQVIEHFGELSYKDGSLNRTYLAEQVFQDSKKLELLNQLVHPRVKIDFSNWILQQYGSYVIREAAILFESETYRDCTSTITVSAPIELRLERVKDRDQTSLDQIKKRMNHQMSDDERRKLADFEIKNFNPHLLTEQVYSIHQSLLGH